MNDESFSFGTLTKRPTAYLPLALSAISLAVIATAVLLFDARHDSDEGWAAHTWQILMAAQVCAVALFAFKWLRQAPRAAGQVLALQAGGIAANLAAVFYLGL